MNEYKQDLENVLYEQKQLKPKESVSFSYQLTPLKTGNIYPSRANISYSVNDMMDEDDDDFTLKTGVSSNWINTIDDALIDNGLLTRNIEDNLDNNQIIILSSGLYGRLTGTFVKIVSSILFSILCIVVVIYPLCEFESNKGDFSFIPFGLGHYVKLFTRYVNMFILSKVRQQMAQMNKTKATSGGTKKEN